LKNRFNRLTSREWLPFQKSWFRYSDENKLLSEHILFFSKAEESDQCLLYSGNERNIVRNICESANISMVSEDSFIDQSIQYALLDFRQSILSLPTLNDYLELRSHIIQLATRVFHQLEHRRFLTIFLPNVFINKTYYPLSWDLAYQLSTIFSLKDEKIACCQHQREGNSTPYHTDNTNVFYCLNFRKDEHSDGNFIEQQHRFFNDSTSIESSNKDLNIPAWFILKPSPRKKNEVLHPAKYPEDLVKMFLKNLTEEGQNVFDPMSGTGSTQVAALNLGRNAYGTELSSFFIEIARERCENIVRPAQKELFAPESITVCYKVINKDARLISPEDFPLLDYVITSPPYWDMLNMKGAENQAKRIEKGLQTNYSESAEDLGNVSDYWAFLNDLKEIYFNIASQMKRGSYMTIVVKNIKKKGKNYPFAWDLTNLLMERFELLPEVFWCQDDINLAPYGYGNTFVSNTFHQYCLTFRIP
jgi:DNA modification methylase